MGLNEASFEILVNGAPLKNRGQVLEIVVTDAIGFHGDCVEMLISTEEEVIQKKDRIEVALGFAEAGPLQHMGNFCVSEIVWGDNGQQVTAVSVPGTKLKGHRNHLWKGDRKIGYIVSEIAREAGMASDVDAEISRKTVKDFRQSNESNLHCLSRLARTHGCILKATSDKIVLVRKHKGRSVSGKPLGRLEIERRNVAKNWRASEQENDGFKSVVAHYLTKVQEMLEREPAKVTVGDGIPVYELKRLYESKDAAELSAAEKYADINRNAARFSFTLEVAKPELKAEMEVTAIGFCSFVGRQRWIAERVVHRFSSRSFTTEVECVSGYSPGELGQIKSDEEG